MLNDWLLILIDIFFVAMLLNNLYWQSQIVVHAKYKISSLIIAVIFGVWVLSMPEDSWWYVVMVAAFLTVTLMQGTGGIAQKRLVTSGFFSNSLSYQKLTHVTLIPVELPNAPVQVISIFTVANRQNIQMTFKQSVAQLQQELKTVLPQNIEVEIAHM